MNSTQTSIDLGRDVNVHFEDRRKSRIFYLFLWLMYSLVFLTKNCFNGALSDIVTEGLLTKSQTGLITGLFYLVYTPGQIVGGIISDRISPARLITLGLLGGTLANALIFFNQNYYVMLAAWTFNAAAQFALWPAVFKIISSQLVRSDRRQMMFGISLAGTAGLILSSLLAALVSDWRYNFAFSAVILLLSAVGLHFMCKWASPHLKWDPPEAIRPDTDHPATRMSTVKVFSISGFFFIFFGTLLMTIVSQSLSSLAPIMLVENYEHISPSIGNLLNIFTLVSGLCGVVAANRFAGHGIKNFPLAMSISILIPLPLSLLCPMVGRIPVVAMVVLLCGITCMTHAAVLFRTNYLSIFARYGKSGAAAGILNSGVSVSYMLAAYVIPLIQESFGWTVTLLIWPALLAIVSPLFFMAGRQYSKFARLESR